MLTRSRREADDRLPDERPPLPLPPLRLPVPEAALAEEFFFVPARFRPGKPSVLCSLSEHCVRSAATRVPSPSMESVRPRASSAGLLSTGELCHLDTWGQGRGQRPESVW